MHDHTLRAPVSLGADKGNDDRPHSYGRAKPLFSCATALIAIAYLIHTAPTAARVPYDSVFECAPPPTCLAPANPWLHPPARACPPHRGGVSAPQHDQRALRPTALPSP